MWGALLRRHCAREDIFAAGDASACGLESHSSEDLQYISQSTFCTQRTVLLIGRFGSLALGSFASNPRYGRVTLPTTKNDDQALYFRQHPHDRELKQLRFLSQAPYGGCRRCSACKHGDV